MSLLLSDIRLEPAPHGALITHEGIVAHLVHRHGLNLSYALAVRQVLDGTMAITGLTGGVGTGKSETLVACIKAVLWQQGCLNPKNRILPIWIPSIGGRRSEGHRKTTPLPPVHASG